MKFRSHVEPPEPMRGLEVPPEVVEGLGGGKRPAVTITINGHSWKSRVAIMRGRYLLGLSNANRKAAGVVTGDEVEVEVGNRCRAPRCGRARGLRPRPGRRSGRPHRLQSPVLQPQAGARARYREREEGRDAHTADREGPGHASGAGLDETSSELTLLVASDHGGQQKRLHYPLAADTTWIGSPHYVHMP